MQRAINSVERAYMRQQLKPFVTQSPLSKVQQTSAKPVVSNRAMAMQHNIKKGLK